MSSESSLDAPCWSSWAPVQQQVQRVKVPPTAPTAVAALASDWPSGGRRQGRPRANTYTAALAGAAAEQAPWLGELGGLHCQPTAPLRSTAIQGL